MSKIAKICLGISSAIMFVFFIVQTLVVFRVFDPSYILAEVGYACVVLFSPFFSYVVYDFIRVTRSKEDNVDLQLKAIDESSLIVRFKSDGKITYVNKSFCEAMGYTASELIGKTHKIFLDKKFAYSDDYTKFWKSLSKGKLIKGEFERYAKDKSKKWLIGHYTPIKDENGRYSTVLKIATDITSQHLAEQEALQKNTYLEHAAKILRHDMHSGINTYMPRGLTSLRRRLSEKEIKQLKIQAPLKMLEEGLKHTQKVFRGVKEFTNLVKEDAQLDMAPHNLTDALNNYLATTSYIKQVDIDMLPTIEVNEPLFCTAIDNLIRNGLKYNDSPKKIVRIFMSLENNKRSICVQDNGRGMSQEEFLYLSKPYIRKKGQTEGGTGLGLNICIAILKEHGFEVKAEKLSNGTKMCITI
tara:strand:- start:1530 stop:2768 length:1239 start_codon:yes stop_codon:yes gene_type:complete